MQYLIKYRYLLLLITAIFSCIPGWTQVQVSAKTDAKQIQIGDQFHLFLEAKVLDNKFHIQWPSFPKIKGIEIVNTGSVDSAYVGKQIIYKQKLTLTSFDSGAYLIPALEFKTVGQTLIDQSEFTDSIQLFVGTIAVDTTAAYKPIKEIILVSKNWWAYWPYFLGAIIIFAVLSYLFILLFKKLKQRKQYKRAHPESPSQKAIRLLKNLKSNSDQRIEGQKQYYSELTQILREYIEKVYAISISEMTTEELMKSMKKDNRLRGVRPEIKHIFQTADLAKFAKAHSGIEKREQCWTEAVYIVNKIDKEQKEGSLPQ
ncbi:MAG TPA: hypothetical protein VLZ83_03765 [Edaphocola sp.]|nr:hypothetical protein [Edaphocola sp.]